MERGTIVGGRFEVIERNRSGGMADIYCARDVDAGDLVALKLLRDVDEESVARFEREVRVLAKLDHSAIVRYTGHGETDAGNNFLVMEWLEGEDLRHFLRERELTIRDTITMIARIAEGLGVAHDAGIIHRDIKPSNLFLCDGDSAKVKMLDFGIARLTQRFGQAPPILTDPNITLGSPGYMAPEQAEIGKTVDTQADIYALGCVFFRCLAKRPPFEGESPIAVMVKTVVEEAPRVSEYRGDVPRELDDLIASMLAKNPSERPRAATVVTRLATIMPAGATPRSRRLGAAQGITSGQQRLLSVVLTELSLRSETGRMARVDTEAGFVLLDALAALVGTFGARLARFADGTVVVMIDVSALVKEQSVRAARCALAMREILSDAPIALATGPGEVSQPLPVGEVIDRAVALLEGESRIRYRRRDDPERGIRIDDVTAGLLDARFQISSDGTGLVLRKERTVEAARTLLGKPTRCVGRVREIELLETILEETLAGSTASGAVVTAPPGYGKSRLRHEFLRRLRRRRQVIETWVCRGDPVGAGSAFSMIAPAVRQTAGFVDGESARHRRDKLRTRLSRHLTGKALERVAMFLGELAGVPPETRTDVQLRAARSDVILMGDQMRRAWLDWLAAELAAQPVVLVLEDLHWGDRPSFTFVDEALRRFESERFMVLALARPEIDELFPGLWEKRPISRICLSELSHDASSELVRQVLGADVPDSLVERLVTRAQGNAFYLEELIRAVAEGHGDKLPETILAMVQARLEGLDAEARHMLRAASIFGKHFEAGGVQALLGGAERAPWVERKLEALAEMEVLSQREAVSIQTGRLTPSGVRGIHYTFRHEMLRDAAYALLTDDDRVLGHRIAGEWLEERGYGSAIVLAEHFEGGQLPIRAMKWYRRAAEHALGGNDFEETVRRCERGLRCAAAGDDRGRLFALQSQAYRWLGQHAETERYGALAMSALPRGSADWYNAAGLVATAAADADSAEKLVAIGNALCSMAPGDTDTGPYLIAMARAADRLLILGRYEFAESLVARIRALQKHPAGGEPAVAAWIHRIRALYARFLGDPATFTLEMGRAAASFEEAGDLRNATLQRGHEGSGFLHGGAYDLAHHVLREALDAAERLGLGNAVTSARINLGLVLARRGALDRAAKVLEHVADSCKAQGMRRYECPARTHLATALALADDLPRAEEQARLAVELTAFSPPFRATALATLASILLQRGSPNEGLREANKAVGELQLTGGVNEGESLVRLVYAEALLASGQRKAAKEAIEAARRRLLERAVSIRDDAFRARFLRRETHNARTLEVARQLSDVSGLIEIGG